MPFGRWRWVVVLLAVGAIAMAALRERDTGESGEMSTTSLVDAVQVETDPVAAVDDIPVWCNPLLDLTEDDSSDVVAMVFAEVADIAPAEIAIDLRSASEVLDDAGVRGDAVTAATTGATVEAEFDAEGRVPEDDPLVRVADHIDSWCRRTGSNPGPPAIAPAAGTPADESPESPSNN